MINRLQRLYFFLVVWFTMISLQNGWGQNISPLMPKKNFLDLQYPGRSPSKLYANMPIYESQMSCFSGFQDEEKQGISVVIKQNPFQGIQWNMYHSYVQPANIYYLQSGYFCKREWELEKATHVPFRFRLGSLAECNAMEGKNQ
jgi:hypothetical protein